MTDKELKEIREKISCPQLNDDHYGEWGILNINQRLTIKRLLDLVDGQEAYIKKQQAEIERLKEKYDRTMTSLKAVLDERADHTETIKEFAERLKADINKTWYYELENDIHNARALERVDELVKEMVGEENDTE